MINSEFSNVFAAENIDVAPVAIDRRLISQSSSSIHRMEEFFAAQLNRRLIVGYADSADAVTHHALLERGIPTLEESDLQIDGLHFWHVPLGSYRLRSVLHTVAQNLERYGEILTQTKALTEAVETAGMGSITAREDGRLLDHFVVVQTEEESGAKVVLAPPYTFLGAGEPASGVNMLRDELTFTDLFHPDSLNALFGEMENS